MQTSKKNKKIPVVVASAMLVIGLAHLPLWLLRPYTVLPQPLFELDLLLATALFCVWRPIGIMAVLVAWGLSLLRAVAVNYHFQNPAEFVDSLRFAGLLSYSAFLTPQNMMIALAMLLGVLGVFYGLRAVRASAPAVLVLTVLFGVADIVNGSATSIGLVRDLPLAEVNVLGSPGYNLLRAEQAFLKDGLQPLAPFEPRPRSYAALRKAADEGLDGNLLLLVESFGLPQARELHDWLLAQLRTPALLAQWDVDEGSEPFVGGTIAGELRVLCGMRGHYSHLTETNSGDCLPRRFRAHGEEATALHGFSPRMFDRAEWWPVAGFDQMRFGDQAGGPNSARCPGAFNGICDHDLIASALQQAAEPRQFVYALTINTHLPLPARELVPGLHELCRANALPDASCQLIQAQGHLLADLSAQLAASSCQVRQVLVVGDHSPPFNDYHDRRVFNATLVPSLLLRRRRCN